MVKQGSNKGIYIFWGSIAVIIAIAILLVVILSNTNTTKIYSNIYDISQSVKQKDSHGKTVNDYANDFYNTQTGTNKTNVQTFIWLEQTLQTSTNFNLTASLYVDNKENLKNLSKTQSSACANAQTSLLDLQSYCQNYVFNSSYSQTELFTAFFNKYKLYVQNLSEFYLATADLLDKNATCGIEITATNLNMNLTTLTNVNSEAFSNAPNHTTVNNIYNQAQIDYKRFN